jgi:uncharacterized protein YbjT (DUF2867 family)
MSLTLVVGATGHVGSSLVQELVQRAQPVRALSSKPARPASGGVEWAQADLVSGQGLDRAFEGVSHAFVFTPPGHPRHHEIINPLIERAARHRLEKVVLMSAMGADADPNAPLRQAELKLEGSGLAWNTLRPNWFMQNFSSVYLPGILATGRIELPVGQAKTSFIDTRDIAAAAARLLTAHDLDNRAFELTGPEALDHDQVAAILSRVTGKTITYRTIEPAVLRERLLAAGLPADYTDFLVMIMGFQAAGYGARVTDGVPQLLGRPPLSFEQYARDHARAWAGAPNA